MKSKKNFQEAFNEFVTLKKIEISKALDKEKKTEEILRGIIDVVENPSNEDAINLGRFIGWALIAKDLLKND